MAPRSFFRVLATDDRLTVTSGPWRSIVMAERQSMGSRTGPDPTRAKYIYLRIALRSGVGVCRRLPVERAERPWHCCWCCRCYACR